jgi:hypothetical protein
MITQSYQILSLIISHYDLNENPFPSFSHEYHNFEMNPDVML